MDSTPNNTAPYLHYHVVCVKCRFVTLARPCSPPAPVEPLADNPVAKCTECGHAQQYLRSQCFLAPLAGRNVDAKSKSEGATAVIAGMVAGIRLARVDGQEIQRQSPRVRSAIADAVAIARQVMASFK